MKTILPHLRVVQHATICAFADYSGMFSWRTWSTAYVGRMITQVMFFALIGLLIGDPEAVHYLLIGHAVIIASHEAVNIIASTTWERRAGTLSLLVASPSNPLIVFLGRCVQLIATGTALATISLVVVGLMFGIEMPWPRILIVPLIIIVIAASTATFGLFIGVYVFRFIGLRLIAINVSSLTFMAICGVSVPVNFWPTSVQRIAAFLPVTHGLQAIRDLLDGAAAEVVIRGVGLELAIAALWLLPSLVAVRWLVDGGRRAGSIEFGD